MVRRLRHASFVSVETSQGTCSGPRQAMVEVYAGNAKYIKEIKHTNGATFKGIRREQVLAIQEKLLLMKYSVQYNPALAVSP